jgi:uncharacterized protein (TIGR03067 family)
MRTAALFAAAALPLAAHAAPAPLPKPVKPDLERMQGTWDIVSKWSGASRLRPMPGWQIVVAGRRLKIVRGGKVVTEWDCTLDPGKKPKHLTMKGVGTRAGFTLLAVYAVEGDSFTLCYNNGRGKRPADLAKPGPSEFRCALKRAKR